MPTLDAGRATLIKEAHKLLDQADECLKIHDVFAKRSAALAYVVMHGTDADVEKVIQALAGQTKTPTGAAS